MPSEGSSSIRHFGLLISARRSPASAVRRRESSRDLFFAFFQARENPEDEIEIGRDTLRVASEGRRPCEDSPCTVRLAKIMRPSGTCAMPRATILCGAQIGDLFAIEDDLAALAPSRRRRSVRKVVVLPAPFAPIERDDIALLDLGS